MAHVATARAVTIQLGDLKFLSIAADYPLDKLHVRAGTMRMVDNDDAFVVDITPAKARHIAHLLLDLAGE